MPENEDVTKLPSGTMAPSIPRQDSYQLGFEIGRATGRYFPHDLGPDLHVNEYEYRRGYEEGYKVGLKRRSDGDVDWDDI
jgi:hypothetical protein